ncbi:MAG: TRAP transporter small permease, partial [bacterium]
YAFLPYCQLTFANVSADVFTAKMKPAKVRFLSRVGSLVAAAFSILLIWRMYEGLLDYQMYLETTTILQVPIWYAFVPSIFSLLLLLLAALITFIHPDGVPEPSLIPQ